MINLQYLEVQCFVCGDSTSMTQSIPVYEDIVLPNDWSGEWFGQPACSQCFEAQNVITKPVCKNDLRKNRREIKR